MYKELKPNSTTLKYINGISRRRMAALKRRSYNYQFCETQMLIQLRRNEYISITPSNHLTLFVPSKQCCNIHTTKLGKWTRAINELQQMKSILFCVKLIQCLETYCMMSYDGYTCDHEISPPYPLYMNSTGSRVIWEGLMTVLSL